MAVNLSSQWDLLVDNRNGQLILAVEVKTKINASQEWAAKYRANVLAHGTFPKTPYFLMVFPDQFYLWTAPEVNSDESKPSFTIDARLILEPYFERVQPFLFETIETKDNNISHEKLQLIFTFWLDKIMYSNMTSEDKAHYKEWLIDTGLHEALSGGKINYEAAR